MNKLSVSLLAIIMMVGFGVSAQLKTVSVDAFDKAIISPHIEVTVKKGDREEVIIERSDVDEEKIKVEVNGSTLRVYLEGAKMVAKTEKIKTNEWSSTRSIYHNQKVVVTIIYRELEELSVRGEQDVTCESLDAQNFHLSLYGEMDVTIKSVNINHLKATIYGENNIMVKSGTIDHQKLVAYGESEMNFYGVNNMTSKVVAYGASIFKLNVAEKLKVSALGEAEVKYKGNPDVNKGIVIGENTIERSAL